MVEPEHHRRPISSEKDISPGSLEETAVLLAVVPDAALAVDVDGVVVAANAAAHELFGYPPGEIQNQRIEALVPERFRHGHRAHRSEYVADPHPRSMGLGMVLRGRRRDASEFPVDISLAPVELGGRSLVVAAVRDMSTRDAAGAALGQLASIVRSSHDAIIAVSPEGRIVSWNPGAEAMLGYHAEEVVGQHMSAVLVGPASEVVEELLGAVMAGESPPARDTRWTIRDGRQLDVAVSLSPIEDERGDLQGFSLLVRDVTERARSEAVQRRSNDLQAATNEVRVATMSGTPAPEVLGLLCATAVELLDAESASVLVSGDDGLEQVATFSKIVAGPPTSLPDQDTIVGEATERRETVVVGASDAPLLVVCPVPLEGSRAGVLVVVAPDGSALTPDAPDVVNGYAGQAALAIELAEARSAQRRLLLASDRERIARDLHDLVIQRLFATGLALQGAISLVTDDRVVGRLADAVDELDTTIREIRTTIFDLERRPSADVPSVRRDVVELAEELLGPPGLQPSIQFSGAVEDLSGPHRDHVTVVLREALSNVVRHAEASAVSIRLSTGDELVLVVEDNGKGLPEARRESGLRNLRSRAEELGGALLAESPPGGGTRLVWRVPVPA